MGYSLFGRKGADIRAHSHYRQALFGLFHVGFVDNSGTICFALSDRDSLSATLDFYQNRVLLRNTFPVFNGTGFAEKDSHAPEVLKQILGLPEACYEHLQLSEDILSQLTFVEGLDELKKEAYFDVYNPKQKKWFTDDFKAYALAHGVFFLYDETKPFIDKSVYPIPVFLKEERLSSSLRILVAQAQSARFAIDFIGDQDDSTDLIPEMKRYDAFSLDRRLDYFLNDRFDAEISDQHPTNDFRKKYAFLLREYFASLVNVLYDEYCFAVLNTVTAKLSFMYVSRLPLPQPLYSISSYQADMFSDDKKTFAFRLQDKERIRSLIQEKLREHPMMDSLELYRHLGLPFEGYSAMPKRKRLTAETVIRSLPFRSDVDDTAGFLSAKRFNLFYSYLPEEKEHNYVFLNRRLCDEGIEILPVPLPASLKDVNLTVKFRSSPRQCSELKKLFFGEVSLAKDIAPAFFLESRNLADPTFLSELKDLDRVSANGACMFFFRSFQNTTIASVSAVMAATFQVPLSANFASRFFEYLFHYPFRIMEEEFRHESIQNGQSLALVAIDGLPRKEETYEPSLPYPYVTYGPLCYSFRQTFFSKPFICSSEKEAIANRISYYLGKTGYLKSLRAKNGFVLSKLGLPYNITNAINPSKDILSQIPFRDSLCHLCLNSQPSAYSALDDDAPSPYNTYQTYIRAIASKNGLFVDDFITFNYSVDQFTKQLAEKTYHSVLKATDSFFQSPLLSPYLQISPKTIVALLTTFFPNDFSTEFSGQVLSFLSLGTERIHKLFFDCDPSLYPDINRHLMVFTRLYYAYRMLERAVAFTMAEGKVPFLESDFCLNRDYNAALPYPQVLLGTTFNAYTDDPLLKDFYFCECDRDALSMMLHRIYQSVSSFGSPKEIETPLILGMLGLPYLAVLKYGSFDLSLGSIDDLLPQFHFRDSICRRCTHISHAALNEPFLKVYPYKENDIAEYRFAKNAMAKDHFILVSDAFLENIRYNPNHIYDINGIQDPLLPILVTPKEPSQALFTLLNPTKETLKEWLFDFSKRTPDRSEIVATASGVILDTFSRNPNVFFQFFFEQSGFDDYRQEVMTLFTEIQRIRRELLGPCLRTILGFLTFIIENIIQHYVEKEKLLER